MSRICLFEAGDFLVGLSVQHIIGTQTLDDFNHRHRDNGHNGQHIFHLQSFLAQQHIAGQQTSSIVLDINTDKEHFFLIVDQLVDEIDVPDSFAPLPPMYPLLASILCPRLILYKNSVAMVLDSNRLMPIYDQLQTDFGLVTK